MAHQAEGTCRRHGGRASPRDHCRYIVRIHSSSVRTAVPVAPLL